MRINFLALATPHAFPTNWGRMQAVLDALNWTRSSPGGKSAAAAASPLIAITSRDRARTSGNNPDSGERDARPIRQSLLSSLDGQVYAQPLYCRSQFLAMVSTCGLQLATAHDSVYASDSDSNSGINGRLSGSSLADADAGERPSTSRRTGRNSITPGIGSPARPSRYATGTLYVIALNDSG